MKSFADLATSRRDWLSEILVPWCRQACYRDLVEAEQDWGNIAGRVDPAMTLWTWAWSRFPAVVHEGMPGLNETCEVRLHLMDGREVVGYPDRDGSSRGEIVLLSRSEAGFEQLGPFRIDAVQSAELTTEGFAVEQPQPRATTVLPPETPPDVRI